MYTSRMRNENEKQIHKAAIGLVAKYKRTELELVVILQKVERLRLYRKLDCSSLFQYATKLLGLSESAAYMFNAVSKKCTIFKPLQSSLESGRLSVTKASRIVSVLTAQNAAQLVTFSETHSFREIDFEVAKLSPKSKSREKVRVLSEDSVEVTVTISKKTFEDLKRIQALKAPANMAQALELAVKLYVKRKDPVQKARRAQSKPLWHRGSRAPLTAIQKHQVFSRDGGRCTHMGPDGKLCNSDKWIHIHHIKPVAQGGSNEPENLTTLCSFHHDLVHQLSLPLDGQVTWLRSPSVRYGAGISTSIGGG